MKNLFKFITICLLFTLVSCDINNTQQKSDSGVTKASTAVKTDASGHTTEQNNIMLRLQHDNEVGAIKHLYIISAYTGDVLFYSTVKGKVTSGSKRLSPKTVENKGDILSSYNRVNIGGTLYLTGEVLDDGGTYGDSGNYLYWFDAQGAYQQYYPSGGTFLQISDKPLRVKKLNLSIELSESK